MAYSYLDDFTKNSGNKSEIKSLINRFFEDKNTNFNKNTNRYTDTPYNQKKREGGEWCSKDDDCKSNRCDTGNKYNCQNKCMNSKDKGSQGCFSLNAKNPGYNNYFVETEIKCDNYPGKQHIYIDNDGMNKHERKYPGKDFSTPVMQMIYKIKNNHHDDAYDYDNWVTPHKKAKIYYYNNKNDILDETFTLELRDDEYLIQAFGPLQLRKFEKYRYQADYDFGRELDLEIKLYNKTEFDKIFNLSKNTNNQVKMKIENTKKWDVIVESTDSGKNNKYRFQTITIHYNHKNERLFTIIIKELYYIDSAFASKYNKGIYRNLLQNYTRDNSDMDDRFDNTSDITSSGKNTCGYVKAPVHSQSLCEVKLVGSSQVEDIESKYKDICNKRESKFQTEGFINAKTATHLQILAFNFVVLGLVYRYCNK